MEKERFEKYYTNFIYRPVGNLVINIAPLRNDIPVLEFVGIDELTKSFIINFKLENENLRKALEDDHIEIHQGANTGKIGKIKVKNVDKNKIRDIVVIIDTTIDKFRKDLFEEIDNLRLMEEKLKRM
jgi:hypothetical protein